MKNRDASERLFARKILISKACEEDLRYILKIQAEAGLSPWSLEAYRDEIGKANSIFLTASKGRRRVVGFIIAVTTNYSEAEILNLGVHLRFRRQGIGTLLLRTALKNALEKQDVKTVWLEVRESNQGAIEYYRKNGFVFSGRRKKFYSNPTEDALLMKLEGDRENTSEGVARSKRGLLD
jgi:ribosomal-protein-alanine N-acetyltransferase